MTKVRFTEWKGRYRIECKEHAGSQEVCSAVSMLLFTLANFVGERGKFSLKSGDSYVEYGGDRVPYDMIKGGFEMLARDYPENVKIV